MPSLHPYCSVLIQLSKIRVSDVAYKVVSKVSCIFLQFLTFTYMRVGCYTGCPYMFPRYPSDKWILMELCRQLISIQKEHMRIHKLGFKFPLKIERYNVHSVQKENSIYAKMQIVTIRTYKYRFDFDY